MTIAERIKESSTGIKSKHFSAIMDEILDVTVAVTHEFNIGKSTYEFEDNSRLSINNRMNFSIED